MRKVLFLVFIVTLVFLVFSPAVSQEEHPDKYVATKTITCTLVGFWTVDYVHILVKKSDGQEQSFGIQSSEGCFIASNAKDTFIIEYDEIERFYERQKGYYPDTVIKSITTKSGKSWKGHECGDSLYSCWDLIKPLLIKEE
jgi:hypothetical protein